MGQAVAAQRSVHHQWVHVTYVQAAVGVLNSHGS
jgi:hypothetical protein